jgi:hypothetical protein
MTLTPEEAKIVLEWINNAALSEAMSFGPQDPIPALIKLTGQLKALSENKDLV